MLLGNMFMHDGGHSKLKASLLHQEGQGCQEHPWTLGISDTQAEQMPAEVGALSDWLSGMANRGLAMSPVWCWFLEMLQLCTILVAIWRQPL